MLASWGLKTIVKHLFIKVRPLYATENSFFLLKNGLVFTGWHLNRNLVTLNPGFSFSLAVGVWQYQLGRPFSTASDLQLAGLLKISVWVIPRFLRLSFNYLFIYIIIMILANNITHFFKLNKYSICPNCNLQKNICFATKYFKLLNFLIFNNKKID